MIRSRVTLASTEAAATQAATRSPFHTARPGGAEPVDREPVGQHVVGPHVELRHGAAQRLDVGHVHAEPVALVVRDDDHRPGQRPAHDLVVAALAGLLGEQLGVGQARARCRPCPAGQDRRAGDQRPGAGTAPGLVDAGDEADAVAVQGALVAVEAGVAAHGRARAGACSWAAGGVGGVAQLVGASDEAEVVPRPGHGEHLADDQVDVDEGVAAQSTSSGRHRWTVESAESERLSPITKSSPSGTGPAVQSHPIIGPSQVMPAGRVATKPSSSTGSPLTRRRPCASQQVMTSPATPTTRFTRCPPSG